MNWVPRKLHAKFSLAILGVVLVFGGINIALIHRSVTNALSSELEKRGLYIARNLAARSVQPILYEDYFSLQQLVDEIKTLDADVAYGLVLDRRGQVVAHSFGMDFPVQLLAVNHLPDRVPFQVQLLNDGARLYRDIAVPVLNREVGVVRIGMLESRIQQRTISVIQIMSSMVVIFLAIGIAGAFICARLIARPIAQIIRAADTFDLKKADAPLVKIASRDELGMLGSRFNEMMIRLREVYAEMRDAQARLIHAEKLTTIGTLAASIAHEVNNPLAGLRNCLRRLRKGPGNAAQTEAYIAMMMRALDRIEATVRGLLNFARQQEVEVRPLSILEVIREALDLTDHRLKSGRIEVRADLGADIPDVLVDRHRLGQVFVNLILNAADAMPEGGRLTVAANYRVAETAGWAEVVIADTGMGISTEVLPHIFEPFYTTKPQGTGLGLSVSRNIIEEHGGKIAMHSAEGQGTRFTVLLPVGPPEGRPSAAAAQLPPSAIGAPL
ncbi:MAG: HAMP domain-containing protein [Candidatus Latescibacteria bacterium]|nr:HAMP domain-containing protein [Candidatus Latescibacterota bacterium]